MDGPLKVLHTYASSKKTSTCAWSVEELDSIKPITFGVRLIWGSPLLSSSLSWNNKDLRSHPVGGGGGEEDPHIKKTGVLVGNFKKNP